MTQGWGQIYETGPCKPWEALWTPTIMPFSSTIPPFFLPVSRLGYAVSLEHYHEFFLLDFTKP